MSTSKTLRHAKLVHTFQPAGDSDAILTNFSTGTLTSFNSLTITNNFNVDRANTEVVGDLIVNNNSNTLAINAPTINIGRETDVTQTLNFGLDSDSVVQNLGGTLSVQGRVHLDSEVVLGNDSDTPRFIGFEGVPSASVTLRDMQLNGYNITVGTSVTTRDSDMILSGGLTINGAITLSGALADSDTIITSAVTGTNLSLSSDLKSAANITLSGDLGDSECDISVTGQISGTTLVAAGAINVTGNIVATGHTVQTAGTLTGTTVNDSDLNITTSLNTGALTITGAGKSGGAYKFEAGSLAINFPGSLAITGVLTDNANVTTISPGNVTGGFATFPTSLHSDTSVSTTQSAKDSIDISGNVTITSASLIVNGSGDPSPPETHKFKIDGDLATGTADVNGNLTLSTNSLTLFSTQYVNINSLPIQSANGTTISTLRFLSVT